MKKYLTILVLFILIISTVSVSSDNKNVKTELEEKVEHDIDPITVFTSFMIEGLNKIVEYDETGFIRDTYMVQMSDGISLTLEFY